MKKITLGSIVMVSDPCYSEPTWCQTKLENVKAGIYNVYVEKQDEGDWGVRCGKLIAIHENYILFSKSWEHHSNCGVDSGQLGIFDYPSYRNDAVEIVAPTSTTKYPDFQLPKENEGDDWYEKMCKFTLSDESWGTYENGVVSSSGIGDGGYDLFVMKDGDEIVGMIVDFLPNYDEEDMEEEVENEIE